MAAVVLADGGVRWGLMKLESGDNRPRRVRGRVQRRWKILGNKQARSEKRRNVVMDVWEDERAEAISALSSILKSLYLGTGAL